jgi:glycine/D-amino acid oxidase-like deaminating enzyme
MNRPHVLVIGAGIIGASIAWHLARAGARVTVTDAQELGGVATRNSWAWLNASWGNPEPYFRLRVHAMHEWCRLEREVPGVHVSRVGSLLWELPPDDLKAFHAEHTAWGYDVRLLDRAEIHRIEPHLVDPPELAVHAPAEGAAEPLSTTHALLAAAEAHGATIIANNRVSSLQTRGGRVIGAETSIGLLEADEVVVAGGVGTSALLSAIGLRVPIRAAPALLVRTQPHDKRLNGLVMSPEMQLRQTPEGQFVAALESPGETNAEAMQAAAVALDLIKGMIASTSALATDTHIVGIRPIPEDGFPVVGRAPGTAGLYIAVTHSGITLAPAIGHFVADELLTGVVDDLITRYGPGRISLKQDAISGFVEAKHSEGIHAHASSRRLE